MYRYVFLIDIDKITFNMQLFFFILHILTPLIITIIICGPSETKLHIWFY